MLLHSTAADRTGRRKLKTRARPFAEDNSAARLERNRGYPGNSLRGGALTIKNIRPTATNASRKVPKLLIG
jgi:hypothetical protein